MHARASRVGLSSLVRQPRQEPPQRVFRFPLVVAWGAHWWFVLVLLDDIAFRRRGRRVGGTARCEAFRGKEEVLYDLHRERLVEDRTLELEARLLCRIEEVRRRERVHLGEVGRGDEGRGRARGVEVADESRRRSADPDVRVQQVTAHGLPDRVVRALVGRDEVRERLVHVRERLERLVRELPIVLEVESVLALFLGQLELLFAVDEDLAQDIDDGRRRVLAFFAEGVDGDPKQLHGSSSELGLSLCPGPTVEHRHERRARLGVDPVEQDLDEFGRHLAAPRRLVVRDDHDESDEEEVGRLLHELVRKLRENRREELEDRETPTVVLVRQVLDEERERRLEAATSLRVIEQELEVDGPTDFAHVGRLVRDEHLGDLVHEVVNLGGDKLSRHDRSEQLEQGRLTVRLFNVGSDELQERGARIASGELIETP